MGLKDILVHVDDSERCAARLDTAIELARAHAAHLTGLYVVAPPYIPPYVVPELPADVVQAAVAQAEQAQARAEAAFRRGVDHAGVAAEWRPADGDPAAVTLHARHADLTVLGQERDDESARRAGALVEHLVFTAGRPVLVVPFAGTFRTVGERVVVAWDGSREATRALNDALPVLQRADRVTVLSVNPSEAPGRRRRIPGADIALHLARHGVRVEAAQTFGHDIQVADIILSRLVDLGADLLVMGAYGHSRFRELVLGGVTRGILAHMTVPVLMSH